MKGHVDLLGPATKVGEELIGIPLWNSWLFWRCTEEKRDGWQIEKAFLMVAGSAVQKFGANLDEHNNY
jgi:hypothetical protein